ncbi:hypothetical protein SAMN05216357_10126 [Porphyromonadaceae bacterium KH3CP3RA]|nr:hypothetical protein SAMN05216357_10126 [Porphyromonadaceae bacterium KH3CP3RA]
MKTKKLITVLGFSIATASIFTACNKDLIEYEQGDIKVVIEKGDEWLHDFPLFLGIEKKNPPQVAMWIEDLNGKYISTIYVTHKIATESWLANKGNRRKEALPVWCHARGIVYPDGLYLPTKDEPVIDAVTGATPHGSFNIKITPVVNLRQFVVKMEVNHSTDWNNHYPKDAKDEDINYSGGKEGSGQPAVVYAATIDLDLPEKEYTASLIGHSSPDGSNGDINTDISTLTTATKIVKQITINIQ